MLIKKRIIIDKKLKIKINLIFIYQADFLVNYYQQFNANKKTLNIAQLYYHEKLP